MGPGDKNMEKSEYNTQSNEKDKEFEEPERANYRLVEIALGSC
jgi:hypothetical protein